MLTASIAQDRFGLALRNDEIDQALAPYIVNRMPVTSPEWQSLVASESARRNLVLRYWRNLLFGWARPARRKMSLEKDYDQIWNDVDLDDMFERSKNQMPHLWQQEGLVLNSSVTQKLHLALIAKAILHLQPSSVLEVGSGWGLNLLALAGEYPDIRFQGIELTAAGVKLTKSLAAMSEIPDAVLKLLPGSPKDSEAYRRISVEQGSAEHLPYPDGSFDLVMTRLALEQMEGIRDKALSEIARVARSYVLMVESFREVNDEGIRRRYAIANDYFRGRLADLPRYGLEPLFAYSDWPHKITLKPVFVLARKTGMMRQ
jgi:ubiquinone/menaquinone biosynthesis C-methylase UbiE